MNFKNELEPNPIIPEKFIHRIEKCKSINKDFEIKIWSGYDCRKLLSDSYPEYLKLYDSLQKPIMRCDMIRYFILYHYGGIYMDCDRICQKDLSELLLKYENYDVLLTNYAKIMLNNDFIYARKSSDFMHYCMSNISKVNYFINTLNILLTAGPLYLLYMYYKYKGTDKIKIINDTSACTPCSCQVNIADKYVYEDLRKSSWLESNLDYMSLFCMCNFKEIIIIILVVLIIYIYYRKKR
jgi:mannosyltransferase OCH1-like enzyme